MADDKKLWKSKTFWVGLLTITIGVLQAIQGELTSGVGLSTLGVMNIFLRLITETKVVLS